MASKENPVDSSAEDSTHDHRIFTLATLLCSTLVYNMKGAFDQEAVNKLTRFKFLKMTQHFPKKKNKVASLEKNQEERNRILDQINDLNEKKRIHWEEENQLLKNEVKHFAERIAELEKKEEERKANGFHAINTEDRKKVKLRNMLKKTRITFEYIKENDKN
ncbi:hypothetical protein MAR_004050 [Mya arenaria]|uniref:Guanylate-binding protein N-terminal domain-containing protein n=1 Tax=Mya arenaria TaxID=6604 RepID=A0ABY7EXA1_MYAAR|nr:hypothetical protein MAR_004050 [Mya arenaria]